MIRFDRFSFSYGMSTEPALREVSLTIAPGEFLLVAGATGSGKSTLLRAVSGLVPQFHGGRFAGLVLVDGKDACERPIRELARSVSPVFQDPETQLVASTVEREVAFGLENLGIDPRDIERAVTSALEALGIAHLRDRGISSLSGGEKQRVTLAAALAVRPRILALDEPLSSLSPAAARAFLGELARIQAETGIAILVAEHRVEQVLPFASRVVLLESGAVVYDDLPAGFLGHPLAHLVRAARPGGRADAADSRRRPAPFLEFDRVRFSYGAGEVLSGASLAVAPGEVVAILGENGSGKTTLLKIGIGLLRPASGTVRVGGRNTRGTAVAEISRDVGIVFQNPNDHITQDSVESELRFTLELRGVRGEPLRSRVRDALALLDLSSHATRHPRTLSGGERERLAIASVLVGNPKVLLLDEPTRGLHAAAKRSIFEALSRIASKGCAVVFATHDLALVESFATRSVRMEQGTIVEDRRAPEAAAQVEAGAFR